MTDLVLALMAALLGAASLAIVLLYRGWKSNRAEITKLHAQIATQQITALTGGTPLPGITTEPEPVRRKRHLALYIGGGIVAAFASIGDRFRNLWRNHRTLTVTAVTTVATVGTAAAIYMAPTGDSGDDTRSSAPMPTAPDQEAAGNAGATPGQDSDQYDTADSPGAPLLMPKSADTGQRESSPGSASPSPSASGTPAAGEEDADAEDALTLPSEKPLTPVPGTPPTKKPETPGSTSPSTGTGPAPDPDPEPDPGPEPQPDPPASQPPDNDGDDRDGLLCLDLPPILDLCLLGNR